MWNTARLIAPAPATPAAVTTALNTAVPTSAVDTTRFLAASEAWSWNSRARAVPTACSPKAMATVCVLSSTSSISPYSAGDRKRE